MARPTMKDLREQVEELRDELAKRDSEIQRLTLERDTARNAGQWSELHRQRALARIAKATDLLMGE